MTGGARLTSSATLTGGARLTGGGGLTGGARLSGGATSMKGDIGNGARHEGGVSRKNEGQNGGCD
jgi:hypothetical protein